MEGEKASLPRSGLPYTEILPLHALREKTSTLCSDLVNPKSEILALRAQELRVGETLLVFISRSLQEP
jgi:hypothetical protein